MLTPHGSQLAVWGDPIAHSRSPYLHGAAYDVLGLPLTYGRRQVSESGFDAALESLSDDWRGLSVTMPLKGVACAAARTLDRRARLTGAVNTLLLTGDGPHGFNTDIGGIVAALGEGGIGGVTEARIIGAGATASSALVALGELGARTVTVVARRPEAVSALTELGRQIGVTVSAASFDSASFSPVELTIAALPGQASLPDSAAEALAVSGGVLLDVVYGHWPTALSHAWEAIGRLSMSGAGMLLHQALLQVRVFVGGDVEKPLDREADVLAAMRLALVGD